MSRRGPLRPLPALPIPLPTTAAQPDGRLDSVLGKAEELRPLETVLVSHPGVTRAERGYRSQPSTRPTNMKSASKLAISVLVGMAIERGVLLGGKGRRKVGRYRPLYIVRDPVAPTLPHGCHAG
jgi:hypothetical protein